MANLVQLRQLESLSGFLLVDKPVGIAFSTVIKSVKRRFSLVKVGHGGSLDASASGLLVLLLNDANKFVGDVMGADREYEGELRFGVTTNTGDAQGVPVDGVRPLPANEFKGDMFLCEPHFAAIRREGTAGYEVVDTGEHAPELGHVYRFDVDGSNFRLRATKGVLPRAIALGMGATLVSLRRTRVGSLNVADAIRFSDLLEMPIADFSSCVKPLSTVLR